MTVYLAAPWELQADVKRFAEALAGVGVGVTSRWIALDPALNTFTDEWANHCLTDIRRAVAFVIWNPEEWARVGTGGRHVELGVAITLRKPIFVIGARTNIFHHMRHVALVPMADAPVMAHAIRAALTDDTFMAETA